MAGPPLPASSSTSTNPSTVSDPLPPSSDPGLDITRRHFFSRCGIGLGSMALASLMGNRSTAAAALAPTSSNDAMAPRAGHVPAKAKSIIFLFMAGGPSQLEMFDWKPKLAQLHGQPIPDSFIEGKRFAFMDSSFKNKSTLLGPKRTFRQHGQSGAQQCTPPCRAHTDRLDGRTRNANRSGRCSRLRRSMRANAVPKVAMMPAKTT